MAAVKINPSFFNHDAQAGGFFPSTHINPGFDIDTHISETGTNILVEGIRGTGKTHILKMISSKCIETYPELKILPVYISLAKVSEWEGSDIILFRIQLYANIVSETISTIEKEKNRIILPNISKTAAQKAIERLKSMFGIKTGENVEDVLSKIKNLNEQLLNKLTYNKEKILEKLKSEYGGKTSAGVSGGVQINIDEFFKKLEESELHFIGKTLAFENAAGFIVEFFKQLKEILCCRYTILLLDECSESSEESQLEIFRLLKLIRGALSQDMHTNYVYFCASVYPPYATCYPTKSKGTHFNFDPGQDAGVEYLQLDELSDDYESFFHELTRKRLEYVKKNTVTDPIEAIFDSENAFILASYGANGIPRRFLEILKQGYANLSQRAGINGILKKISQKDIETALQVVASSQILSPNKLNTEDLRLIEDITQRISKRNKKKEIENKEKTTPIPANVYFTISFSKLNLYTNLLLQGCVHDKGRTRLRKYYREEGSKGPLLMLDLTLAYHNGAVDKRRIIDIFRKDIKENAKSGYLYCQDFDIDLIQPMPT
jgi:hypothetical protein